MRVLLVEDEFKLAQVIQRGLAEESFAVEVVRDGEAALERARHTANPSMPGSIKSRMMRS